MVVGGGGGGRPPFLIEQVLQVFVQQTLTTSYQTSTCTFNDVRECRHPDLGSLISFPYFLSMAVAMMLGYVEQTSRHALRGHAEYVAARRSLLVLSTLESFRSCKHKHSVAFSLTAYFLRR